MIYGSSKDPVLVKKINLKVWSLREEIESVIQQQVDTGAISESSRDMTKIADEYKGKVPLEKLVVNQDEDTAETNDEEQKEGAEDSADEAEEGSEDSAAEEEGEGESEGVTEDDMARAMVDGDPPEDDSSKLQIRQRIPDIPKEQVGHAKAIMSEIWIDRILLFSSRKFLVGQSVVVEFVVPQPFALNGTIISCRVCNPQSRIISEKKLAYRIAIEFSFLKAGERIILRDFLNSIEPDKVAAPAKVAAVANDEEDDDDDLSDFGL